MKSASIVRASREGRLLNNAISAPFAFLPVVVEALEATDVSCRFCSVKLISRHGLVAGLCPTCFEECCATCGARVIVKGRLASGLTVGRRGSWKCADCARSARSRRPAKPAHRSAAA